MKRVVIALLSLVTVFAVVLGVYVYVHIYIGKALDVGFAKENTSLMDENGEMFSEETLRVGFAKVNISPMDESGELIPVPLGGYAGLRICESIESDIFTTCTAFEDQHGNRALIYSIDSIDLKAGVVEKMLSEISEQTNVKREYIVLNCTHNHSAPEISSTLEAAAEYASLLTGALVEAGSSAIKDLADCSELQVGEIALSEFSYIRRTGDQALVDPSVPVARFCRKDKNDVLLVNWAAHCDTISISLNLACSSDYVGVFRDYIERELGINVSLHMGACADVNPLLTSKNTEDTYAKDFYGEDLAKAVIESLEALKTVKINSRIDSAVITVGAQINHADDDLFDKASEIHRLYYGDDPEKHEEKCKEYGIINVYEALSIVDRYNDGQYGDITVGAISIGNIGFAFVPYEMFAENGAVIKDRSPFDLTFVMGYSNGHNGYIAADHAFDVGGYEVYSCRYARGTAEQLQNQMISMLNDLYSDTNCHHELGAYQTDEEYHWLCCTACNERFQNPTKHRFDNVGICTVCDFEHEHQWQNLKGFSGMTISALGSSITMGAGIERPYVDVLADILGMREAYNYGISWSTLGYKEDCDCEHPLFPEDYHHDPMVFRYAEIESADIICVCGGFNDFGVELPLGNIDDTEATTFYGALNVLFASLKREYPDSYIFMMTGFHYFEGYSNGNGDSWASFNTAMKEVCEKYGIDCMDVYTSFPFNYLYDTYDGVHMTQEFTSEIWAPAIAEFIKENFHPPYYYKGCAFCSRMEKLEYQNLFSDVEENHGKICTYDLKTKRFAEKESQYYSYALINVEQLDGLRFAFSEEKLSDAWSYFFYDENDVCVGNGNLTVGLTDVYVSVPDSAVYVGVIYKPQNIYGVYGAAS